jgi:hypothetical protein
VAQNPVGWFEIYVQDTEPAKKFYETVLQTKLERLDSPGIGQAAASRGRRCRSVSTASSPWRSIPKVTCSGCTRPGERAAANHRTAPPGRLALAGGRLYRWC